jgi:hypothetical protein
MSQTNDPWVLADVDGLLTEVARRIRLYAGLDVIAVVDTSPDRALLGCEALPFLPRLSTGYEVWDLTRHVLEEVFIRLCPERGPGDPPLCTIHLLRCRDGRVVPTTDEGSVGYAMLHANNPVQAFIGDIITLTPHGWREHTRGGLTPTLSSLGRKKLRAV